ncbi:MAG: hypothetical protein IPG86_15645 [Chitinophagaceae bacterium]|nr:hypothetical protein [Chitinophagaceae bacterium]
MKKSFFSLPVIALIFISGIFASCKKDDVVNMPVLTTAAVTNVTSTTATVGGEITDNGGGDITASGVCYATVAAPTTANTYTTGAPASGAYTTDLTALAPATTYYLRAYATNSAGTSYGNEVSFTTLP